MNPHPPHSARYDPPFPCTTLCRSPRHGGHEIFGQFAPGRIAAADDDSLEREARQQEALKPAGPSGWPGLSRWFRAVHARQVSTSAAKAAPPRIGSATGKPSRRPPAAHSASRQEESRAGNEGVKQSRTRGSPYHEKKKHN